MKNLKKDKVEDYKTEVLKMWGFKMYIIHIYF